MRSTSRGPPFPLSDESTILIHLTVLLSYISCRHAGIIVVNGPFVMARHNWVSFLTCHRNVICLLTVVTEFQTESSAGTIPDLYEHLAVTLISRQCRMPPKPNFTHVTSPWILVKGACFEFLVCVSPVFHARSFIETGLHLPYLWNVSSGQMCANRQKRSINGISFTCQ